MKVIENYINNIKYLDHSSHCPKEELLTARRFLNFNRQHPGMYGRNLYPGHFTGSAMVVNHDLSKVLLTLHAKLNQWLQLGGHADGDRNILRVAIREAEEESGLNGFTPISEEPFDLDCHFIPARKSEPSHFHFDIRYLLKVDDTNPLQITDESHDLKWFEIDEARKVTAERSMHRQFDKIEAFR